MIRPEKHITETCDRCKRPGWTRKVFYNLVTEEEYEQIYSKKLEIKDAPEHAEKCYVRMGSDVGVTIEEAIELAVKLNRPVVFDFNERLIVVNQYSDPDVKYREWVAAWAK